MERGIGGEQWIDRLSRAFARGTTRRHFLRLLAAGAGALLAGGAPRSGAAEGRGTAPLGRCGAHCPRGQLCRDGRCACPAGKKNCGTKCIGESRVCCVHPAGGRADSCRAGRVCCPDLVTGHRSRCLEAGEICCRDGRPCPSGSTCCYDPRGRRAACCGRGEQCSAGKCTPCPTDRRSGARGEVCCPEGHDPCGDGCCDPDQFCDEKTGTCRDTCSSCEPRLRYAALGDSIAVGRGSPSNYGYVRRFRDYLEAQHGSVALTNRARDGDDSAELLALLRGDPVTREAVKNADVLTISIGGNNLLGCGSDNYTTLDEACAARGVAAFGDDWPRILAEVRQPDLIGSAAKLYAMTLYNPYRGDDPDYATAESYIQQINAAIRDPDRRSAYDYEVADVHADFQGQFDNGTWKVCAWTGFCRFIRDPHPTDSGHAEISAQHEAIYP